MTIWPWRGKKVLSVAHVFKLYHGEYRKKFKPVDYDKCTEELGDSSQLENDYSFE